MIDLYSGMIEQAKKTSESEDNIDDELDSYFSDGVHFSSKGQKVVYDIVKDGIRKNVGELDSDKTSNRKKSKRVFIKGVKNN